MNRRSYINRQRTHSADMIHSCTWCGRFMVDVLEIRGTGAGEILCECVNRRACMKERTIKAIAARDARAAALAAAAAPVGRAWAGMAAADFDTDTGQAPVQLDLFGAELPGRGELAGQGSLFGARA